MLFSQLPGVHMRETWRHFVIAVLLTIADSAVVLYYGGEVWQTWSGNPWRRMLILLFAAVWAGSLANMWAHVRVGRGLGQAAPAARDGLRLGELQSALPGERDV